MSASNRFFGGSRVAWAGGACCGGRGCVVLRTSAGTRGRRHHRGPRLDDPHPTHRRRLGRPDITFGDDECTYALATDFGVVFFNRLYHKDHTGPVPQGEWCAGLDDFVAAIEPLLDA
ncbi:hypothetical protein [Rhodococcus artemisiae]|uniref:SUKH-3 immunity protein of toxin-antitoxin system n=1 Tax=Rhodococcus artemisiae TaxID=714159 RepID=A0ABU7LJR2_9NOCA|nr:hypothetical protein [Rhodococcus artemisiae]MEE2061484.1 hypothetical protein [Rhodococcus artemisiae]